MMIVEQVLLFCFVLILKGIPSTLWDGFIVALYLSNSKRVGGMKNKGLNVDPVSNPPIY